MKILFVDEYGETLFSQDDGYTPTIGDAVSLEDEDWRIKSRTFIPALNLVIIELTQNLIRSKAPDEDGGRLKEMQRAIVEVNKRQDQHEKKSRLLREQLVSVRQYIRRNNKPKETT